MTSVLGEGLRGEVRFRGPTEYLVGQAGQKIGKGRIFADFDSLDAAVHIEVH